ncbi:MAG: hypothetical protein KDD69_02575 [Bdellovibrionales bacterium]|nr:hypothetical protein [Bdellovibrionales bacterium]
MPLPPVTFDAVERSIPPSKEALGRDLFERQLTRPIEGGEAVAYRVSERAIEPFAPDAPYTESTPTAAAEFEASRLEAGARLALTVERVELENRPRSIREFQEQSVPVIVFGSLELDVLV